MTTPRNICPPARDPYTPFEAWSPSGLSLDRDCRRAYGERYIAGRNDKAEAWADVEHLERPPLLPASAPVIEREQRKEERKAWARRVRRPMGGEVHAIYEAHFAQSIPGYWHPPMPWRNMGEAWTSRVGQIALPGRRFLPDPAAILGVEIEASIEIDLIGLDFCDPPRFNGKADLLARTAGGWHLYDYKSTSDFQYIKTPAELADDEQANLYALHAMQRHGLDSIGCTWIYVRTEGAPDARAVHFTITRADAEKRVAAMAEQAAELRAVMRQLPVGHTIKDRLALVSSLPQNPGSCDKYGPPGKANCPYHVANGGDCNPKPLTLGAGMLARKAQAAKLEARKTTARETALSHDTRKRNATMAESFAEKKARLAAEKAAAAAGTTEPAPPPDVEAEGEEVAEAPAAAATPKPAVSPAVSPANTNPAAKPAKPPKLPDAGIVVAVEGHTFDVPASSALGKALAKAAKAHAALAAAFEGE